MKQDRLYLEPQDVEGTLLELAHVVRGLDEAVIGQVRCILPLFARRAMLLLAERQDGLFNRDNPFYERFTFDLETDTLLLFSTEPDVICTALIEMAMYLAGFSAPPALPIMWQTELAWGAWRVVMRNIRRSLGIAQPQERREANQGREGPVLASWTPSGTRHFQALVAQLDSISFAYMVRIAGREDVAIRFPANADPAVQRTYRHAREAVRQIGMGVLLGNSVVFNRRLSEALLDLDETFQPEKLVAPVWWHGGGKTSSDAVIHAPRVPDDGKWSLSCLLAADDEAGIDSWMERGDNPYRQFLDALLGDDDTHDAGMNAA
ncbi:MAG: hypothetical protein JW910_07315 [Anaerolineae bacterium]|nr:hypothetical protein [Anaerolineae bacterium]